MKRIILILLMTAALVVILTAKASAQERQKTIIIRGEEKEGEPPRFEVEMPRDRQPMIFRGDMDSEMRVRMNRERELEEMRLNDPERFKLVSEIDELERASKEAGEKYRKSEDAFEKETLKAKITETLDKLFDLKVQIEELDQKRQEKELAKKKERIEKRKTQKKDIIQLRLDELLGKNDLLKW